MNLSNEFHELSKRVVRIGFIIASADGLDANEKEHLVTFAKKRSNHLSEEEINVELEKGLKGPDSLSKEDVVALKKLSKAELGKLLNEIVHQVAGHDGTLTEPEVKALNNVWKALA